MINSRSLDELAPPVKQRAEAFVEAAKAKGKSIFVVEYLSGGSASSVASEIRRQGFVPNFAGRDLSN
jgi:hypothetical protein